MVRARRWAISGLLVAAVLAGCAPDPGDVGVEDPEGFDEVGLPSGSDVEPAPPPTSAPSASAESPASPQPSASAEAALSPSPSPAPEPSEASEPYPVALTWDGIDLTLPSARTELVGFHESNHDGARDVQAYEGRVDAIVMESRERGTGSRSASDIVVAPDAEVRAMVTGTVKRAGSYTLYCDKKDDFVVIEPDGRPEVEVKMLHIDGVQVRAGDRVEAGVTVLAPRPTILPFASQVDEHSANGWPHVHVEVVDTRIPDIPNSNSGSDDC